MTTIEKITKLDSLCKCGLEIYINPHKLNDEPIQYFIADLEYNVDLGCDDEVRKEIIKLNTIVQVQFYPSSSVAFYRVDHYDLDKALDICFTFFD